MNEHKLIGPGLCMDAAECPLIYGGIYDLYDGANHEEYYYTLSNGLYVPWFRYRFSLLDCAPQGMIAVEAAPPSPALPPECWSRPRIGVDYLSITAQVVGMRGGRR